MRIMRTLPDGYPARAGLTAVTAAAVVLALAACRPDNAPSVDSQPTDPSTVDTEVQQYNNALVFADAQGGDLLAQGQVRAWIGEDGGRVLSGSSQNGTATYGVQWVYFPDGPLQYVSVTKKTQDQDGTVSDITCAVGAPGAVYSVGINELHDHSDDPYPSGACGFGGNDSGAGYSTEDGYADEVIKQFNTLFVEAINAF